MRIEGLREQAARVSEKEVQSRGGRRAEEQACDDWRCGEGGGSGPWHPL